MKLGSHHCYIMRFVTIHACAEIGGFPRRAVEWQFSPLPRASAAPQIDGVCTGRLLSKPFCLFLWLASVICTSRAFGARQERALSAALAVLGLLGDALFCPLFDYVWSRTYHDDT